MASTPGDWQRELSNYNRSFVSSISELLRIVRQGQSPHLNISDDHRDEGGTL